MYIFESYSEIEKYHYIVYDKFRILNIMDKFKDCEMPLLFCDYYAHIFNKQKYEDNIALGYDRAVQCGDISILTDTLNIGFAQWELMKRLILNIEVDSHKI